MVMMLSLDDKPADPSVAPAQGTGVATAPPTAPGAVGQAIQMAKGIDSAADARMANNPMMSRLLGQVDLMQGDTAAAIPQVQARSQQIADLVAQPDPARIATPRLAPLPPPPTIEEIAKKRGVKPEDFDNPMRVFGQAMPVLAALAGGLIAKNGTVAIQAATAAMAAVKAGDKEAYERAHKEWLESTKATVDGNAQLASEYRMALEDRKDSMAERLAKVQALAAQNQDTIAMAAIRGGYIQQLSKLVEMRDAAGKPIQQLVELSMEDQRHREEMQLRAAAQAAEMYYKVHPPLTSQDEVKAALAKKVMDGGVLTPQEESAKKMLMDFAEHNTMPWGMGAPGAGGAAPGATTTPAAPASTATPADGKTQATPVRPKTREEAMALPSGTWFVSPTGAVIRRK